MAKPHARLIDERLVELAGHCRLLDAVATEVLNRATQPAPSKPFEVLADAGERRVGQVGSTDAGDVIVLTAKCFSHQHGVTSPGGEQANAFVGAHAACSDELDAGFSIGSSIPTAFWRSLTARRSDLNSRRISGSFDIAASWSF